MQHRLPNHLYLAPVESSIILKILIFSIILGKQTLYTIHYMEALIKANLIDTGNRLLVVKDKI